MLKGFTFSERCFFCFVSCGFGFASSSIIYRNYWRKKKTHYLSLCKIERYQVISIFNWIIGVYSTLQYLIMRWLKTCFQKSPHRTNRTNQSNEFDQNHNYSSFWSMSFQSTSNFVKIGQNATNALPSIHTKWYGWYPKMRLIKMFYQSKTITSVEHTAFITGKTITCVLLLRAPISIS